MLGSLADRQRNAGMQSTLSWDFFRNLPEEREAFLGIARRKTYKKTEMLYHEGDMPDAVFYIIEGDIVITKVSISGKEVVVYIHKKGALMGIPSAMTGLPRTSTAQPLGSCVVYEALIGDLKLIMDKYPVLINRIMLQNYGSLAFMTSQYLSAFSDDAETRLKKLLARLFSEQLLNLQQDCARESVPLNVTQDKLASSIGITRTRVNKILHRLAAAGLIEIAAHRISLVQPEHFLNYLVMIPENLI